MTERRILPQRRRAETFLVHWKFDWSVTIGFHHDGTPGEVFVTGCKSGVEAEAVARDGAVMLSLALQYGVPLEVIDLALTKNSDGSPSSLLGAVVLKLIAAKQELGVT